MVTKFVEGAWIVIVAIPVLIGVFIHIHRHYEQVAASLTLDGIEPGPIAERYGMYTDRNHLRVVVLMNSLNRCSLQALEYALRMSDNVRVCSIEVEPEATERLMKRWQQWNLKIPVDVLESPYREIGKPLIHYLHHFDEEDPEPVPTVVVLPEFVVSHWWERFLHNQTTVAIRAALYSDQIERGRGRPVISVPYRIGDDLYEPIVLPVKHEVVQANGVGSAPPSVSEPVHQDTAVSAPLSDETPDAQQAEMPSPTSTMEE
jgi:hypothetical protein